jgi:hypothetical protein
MKCYRIVANAERMKTGRPGESTVYNVIIGTVSVCQAANLPLDSSVNMISRKTFDNVFSVKQTPSSIKEPYTVGAWIWGDWIGHEGAMRTDQRANIKTGHSRVFFIQTENAAGRAFFQLKNEWHRACDIVQKTPVTVFGT